MADEHLVIGIDIAASRPCTAVALRCGRTAHAEAWMEALPHDELGRCASLSEAENAASSLADALRRAGRADNVTFVLLDIEGD